MTTTEKQIRNILLSVIFIMLSNSFFWQYLPKGSYYILDAIGWVLFAGAFNKITHETIQNYKIKLLGEYIFLATCNNLLDEVIFQNINVSYAEFVIFVFVTLLYTYKYVKRTD